MNPQRVININPPTLGVSHFERLDPRGSLPPGRKSHPFVSSQRSQTSMQRRTSGQSQRRIQQRLQPQGQRPTLWCQFESREHRHAGLLIDRQTAKSYDCLRVVSRVKMASACERLDELVKEYLLFRGFTAATKALDHEMKHDKDKGLRVCFVYASVRLHLVTILRLAFCLHRSLLPAPFRSMLTNSPHNTAMFLKMTPEHLC